MAVTPEGKVKRAVNKLLDEFLGPEPLASPQLYRYWPVPSGYGESSLDCIVCYRGHFVAIETKAPGKKPTPRQEFCIANMRQASAKVFVIASETPEELGPLRLFLMSLSKLPA